MRVKRIFGFLGLASTLLMLAVVLGAGCGGSGGATSGQACFMASDCAEGLYCFGVTMTSPGKCTSNADLAQPEGGDAFPDGGYAPMLDAPPPPDTPVTPQKDGTTPTDTSAPKPETAPPPPEDTGSPADTGAKDTASSG